MRILLIALAIAVASRSVIARAGVQSQPRADESKADPAPKHESPFACDRVALTPEARKRHFDELGPALRGMVRDVRELPNGFEFEFRSDPATVQLVAEWAAGEHLCCPFFDIDLELAREGGALWLRLTGREGVKQFIKADFARWFPR